ncbi:uncharacterized protein LOC127277073 isoform X2 [Leptopilina boulardi]|nr:uncharacterized protein LOC127277073 isoform X2 [Leptopilina boulardi]
MHGIRRVIIFCILTTVLPTLLLILPLYLRHVVYADVTYAVTESDILEIKDGVSSIFCSAHKLKMNETFNSFQVSRRPETTSYRKHIRLKKSMTLPDDTLEYWGFYLLKGATVALSVCSRFEGASILVVKGERNLKTCGLLDHNKNKARATGIYLPEADQQVKITFESNAQEIHSKESKNQLEIHQRKFSQRQLNETEIITEKKQLNIIPIKEKAKEITKSNQIKNTKRISKKLRNYNKRQNNNKFHETSSQDNLQISEMNNKKRINLLKAKFLEEIPDTAKEENDEKKLNPQRHKRHQEPVDPPKLLDQGIRHGGNAAKKFNDSNINNDEDSSISSFENGLFTCYGGQVLLAQEFNESEHCMDVSYLINGKHMQSRHDVIEPGYYYYIFYSDNDKVSNDIHAVFDIYKPTLQYENVTLACINKTECTFPLPILTSERVIVEVPTKDGIDHEMDDISLLVSTCVPRMGVYIIFPIAVLFLILSCAFV